MEGLEARARHWEALADESERTAAWDRERGIDLSPAGSSAGDHRARTYRRVADALRIEARTGVPVCACCHKPQGSSATYWRR